jgi:hypothetical protein
MLGAYVISQSARRGTAQNQSLKPCIHLGVVDHHSCGEAFARSLLELAQAAKVRRGDGGRRLDLDSRQFLRASFEHDIHLRVVLVAEVEEADPFIPPARLAPQFLKDERLQKLSQQRAICNQRRRIHTHQHASQPGIAQVELGRFDQPAQAIAVPRREHLHSA